MQLELVPMLQIQRNLYDIPRGWERFSHYLTMMTGDTDDLVLPLPAMNPMGKEHVAATYDALLALDAEAVAMRALAAAQARLSQIAGEFRVGLVVSDDAQGGWTNRHFSDYRHRFDAQALLKRGWIVAICWTGEQPSAEGVNAEVLMAVFRTAYVLSHGWPTTLRAMLVQEGLAAIFAGVQPSTLDREELDYIREVIQPHLNSDHFPTLFACLYGDEAAYSVGYPMLGLSSGAGFALALDDARHLATRPEALAF